MAERYDYVVIGGGSAGCVAAAELSADPRRRVLLVEHGQPAEENPETLLADGYKHAFANERLMFERLSEPQPGCGGRRLFMGSGRGMGGSGSINAMVYTRGSEADFAEWPAGWRWRDVAADFEAIERVLDVRCRAGTRFTEACIAAAEDAGFRRKRDLNDGDLDGVLGYEWMNYAGETRRSSYAAFLAPVRHRPNLEVQTSTLAERILFDDERRAVGVELATAPTIAGSGGGGSSHGRRRVAVGREVVLAAGAIESPKLLMLSGVGPDPELRRHGILPVAPLEAVGRNFHDHPNVTLFFLGHHAVDCNYPQLYGFHRIGRAPLAPGQPDGCFVFYPARSSLREAMMRLLPAIVLPPSLYRARAASRLVRATVGAGFALAPLRRMIERVYGIVVILGKPNSRGTIRLRSARGGDPPLIDPAYLQHPSDLEAMLGGIRLARRIAGSPPLVDWGQRELFPGRRAQDDERLAAFVRANVMTTYHYAGTLGMGEASADAVDTRLRLRGVRGVRVADASAIPRAPVSALNAPSMLIGYRASRYVVQEHAG